MKKTRRFAAMLAAMALAATMVAPTMMNASANNNTITITNTDGATHSYVAYKIFSGNFSGGTLNNIIWGNGVNGSDILTALHTASETSGHALYGLFPSTVDSAAKVAEVLGSRTTGNTPTAVFEDDSAKAQAFAAIVGANLTSTTSGSYSNGAISGLDDGYYLIQDSAAPSSGTGNSGAKTRFIVHVTDNTTVSVNAKHAAPTVDKQVQDEAGDKDTNSNDADGWGETADHAINESFQFKLTATLAKDADYAAYDTYRVLFTDVLNAGVTYEDIVSVKVNGNDVTEYVDKPTGDDSRTAAQKSGYKVTEPTVTSPALGGGTLTISIGDIKQFLGSTSWADTNNNGVTVEVIYTAHLNENATVENTSQNSVDTDYSNVNKVKLNYSNNPNVTGTGDSGDTPGSGNNEEFGETPDDYVWVFTYEVDNTKVDDKNAPLAGAGFRLYQSNGTTEIGLIYDNTMSAYRPVKSSETATEMTSAQTTGVFNIKGLDAGTYVLKETTVPNGYNKCDDITITIGAEHEENSGGATAALTLSEGSTMNNTIINKKGSELPSTGGMGTKLFIAGGGITATLAAVYLVSKKRSKED